MTTSITNLDVHDISRTCMTYGITQYHVINPLKSMHDLFERITGFWQSNVARKYNADRSDALQILKFMKSVDDSIAEITKQEGIEPIIVTTTAIKRDAQIGFGQLKQIVETGDKPVLLIFGTGNGLANEIHQSADYVLEPIYGTNNYNHLSVRSAVAIILDRIFSEK